MTDEPVTLDDETYGDRYELPRGRPPPGEWAERGACVGKPPEWFFPGRGEAAHEALALCSSCPVQPQCLEHALRCGEKFGVWGGTSERKRRRMRRSIRTESTQGAA